MPKSNWGSGIAGATGGAGTGFAIGGPVGAAIGGGIGLLGGLFGGGSSRNHKVKQQTLLTPEQQQLQQQLIDAGMGPGAGGAFGQSSDYYRDILNDNPELMEQFMAPELRRYNQDIIPGLSEQFAGMGSGGLASSGFRNAQVQGATDLSERLGAIRANLKQQAAQGLSNIGAQGLKPTVENLMPQPQPSFMENASGGFGEALPYLVQGAFDQNKTQANIQQPQNKVGQKTSPYGTGRMPASPNVSGKWNLPTFGGY